MIAAVGDNFESANAAAMYHARDLVSSAKVAGSEFQEEINALRENVRPEWLENWYDGLGFCGWPSRVPCPTAS